MRAGRSLLAFGWCRSRCLQRSNPDAMCQLDYKITYINFSFRFFYRVRVGVVVTCTKKITITQFRFSIAWKHYEWVDGLDDTPDDYGWQLSNIKRINKAKDSEEVVYLCICTIQSDETLGEQTNICEQVATLMIFFKHAFRAGHENSQKANPARWRKLVFDVKKQAVIADTAFHDYARTSPRGNQEVRLKAVLHKWDTHMAMRNIRRPGFFDRGFCDVTRLTSRTETSAELPYVTHMIHQSGPSCKHFPDFVHHKLMYSVLRYVFRRSDVCSR